MTLSAPEPDDLMRRQARARELRAYDEGIVDVLQEAQGIPGVAEHLGLARQAIEKEMLTAWPPQSWESTSMGGPPRVGDLHVKVTSVIGLGQESEDTLVGHTAGGFLCPEGIALRIGISAIRDGGTFGPEAGIYVPLDLVPMLVVALQEQGDYWTKHPPR